MVEATRSRELSKNLKKHEILLMEEIYERLATEQHNNNQLKKMVSIQSGLQSSIASIATQQQSTGKNGFNSKWIAIFNSIHREFSEGWSFHNLMEITPEHGCLEVTGSFNKLNQTGTVSDYLEKFEELKSHMLIFNKDCPEEYFSTSFVSGLRDDIRGAIMSMKLKDFHQTVTLAKKQEGTVDAIIRRASLTSKNFSQNKPTYRHIPSTYSQSRNPQIPPKPPYQNQPETNQPHRKLLTASEMGARKEKNLCYNCEETFVPGHRCKQRQIYMIMSEEEELIHNSQLGNEITNEIEDEMIDDDMTISLNSLSGTTDMNTLRIQGSIKGQDVHILIDSGSTHCFLDENIGHKLWCKLDYTTPMIVSVADGSKMNGKKLTIRSMTDNASLQLMSAKSFSKFFKRKGAYGLIGHLFSVTATPLNTEPNQTDLENLLHSYTDIFQELTSVPPSRVQGNCLTIESKSLIPSIIGAPKIHRWILKLKPSRQIEVKITSQPLKPNDSVPLIHCQTQKLPRHTDSVEQGMDQISSSKSESNGYCSSHSVTPAAAQHPTINRHLA
ncbi:hypothetical protein BUALT_Bualt10G0065200 [Buddleja alternifolia]|uniref:Retrotransposon gag domain-containing protein n=1 Tax=Buddleja alternifolia TaxID=168488 RepID=A0AAV6X7C1_9LAMI|nr:hypothetical protein BUALT_Bualt10G0065200 [Buddleja alternifolia]